jgi:hypothetical protein
MNTIAIVNANAFRKDGRGYDRNGKQNIFLTCIAGKMPNKCMVMSGTVAEQNGIEIGKTYMVAFNEGKTDPQYGRQFSTTKLGEVSVIDTLTAVDRLGEAVVVDVTAAAPAAPAAAPVASAVETELPVND